MLVFIVGLLWLAGHIKQNKKEMHQILDLLLILPTHCYGNS